MSQRMEITIPKKHSEVVWSFFMSFIVVFFLALSLVNLWVGLVQLLSALWIAFIALVVWSGAREAGGIRPFLVNWLGGIVGRHFLEAASGDFPLRPVRLGYEIFGRRFYSALIPLRAIRCVNYSAGQATGLAGRDMKDWSVFFRCDKGGSYARDIESAEPVSGPLTLGDMGVGPLRAKELTEKLALEIAEFLQAAGAPLVKREGDNVFVRQGRDSALNIGKE
jgi:hypothetical protein